MANIQNAPVNAFARALGQSNSGDILDYSQDTAKKFYKSATALLVSLHDLSVGNLCNFLQQLLEQRIDVYDWNTITEIEGDDGTFINLLKQYRNIMLAQVRKDVK